MLYKKGGQVVGGTGGAIVGRAVGSTYGLPGLGEYIGRSYGEARYSRPLRNATMINVVQLF